MKEFSVKTDAHTSFVNITGEVQAAVAEAGIESGVVTVFVPHTTAGVTINENADPDVVVDMRSVLDKVVPWIDDYRHFEGNAAAHVKASMMGPSVQVIVESGHLQLGMWQGIYFCEFDGPRARKCWVK